MDAKGKEDVTSTFKLPAVCFAKLVSHKNPLVTFTIKIESYLFRKYSFSKYVFSMFWALFIVMRIQS